MCGMRSVADVEKAVAAGERVEFVFFWGTEHCLSQWHASSFSDDEHTFATAEHYMMWRKAILFDDHGTAERVLAADHPRSARDLGRQVKNFHQATWEANRSQIVVDGNTLKFTQHEDLGKYLLDTGDRVLVEASPFDRIWGIGLREDDPRAADPARWRGLNLLGFALGDVREILRARNA